MALVRCPIHGLNFNDDNPRGCPACAAERKGRASQAALMQDLVKATKKADGVPDTPKKPNGPAWWAKIKNGVPSYDQRKVVQIGSGIIVALIVVMIWMSQPKFVEQVFPPDYDESAARTFPVNTGQEVSVVFAILGTQVPSAHPSSRSVERYEYGSSLFVDGINGSVYSIHLGVPNRTWRGLRVGAPQTEVEGMLALLARPAEGGDASVTPTRRGKYDTYENQDAVPTKTMTAEVRPPNGCFDAVVELQPRTLGLLIDGNDRYPVVAIGDDGINWVATSISIIDRARNGPIADRAC
jgi:hypothetical protein